MNVKTTQPTCDDYTISTDDAKAIAGLVLLPADIRVIGLTKYLQEHGDSALVNLFAQFMGMANSVIDNHRVAMETIVITETGRHPDASEHVNFPTMFGALMGVQKSNRVNQKKVCATCAYRHGSWANQSPNTQSDVISAACGIDGDFMCHEGMGGDGDKPTRKCRGYQLDVLRRASQ